MGSDIGASEAVPAGLILYTTWPSAETAAAAARELVGAGLAACANLLPAGRSFYLWEGRLQDEGRNGSPAEDGGG